jgi:hypothetical protein
MTLVYPIYDVSVGSVRMSRTEPEVRAAGAMMNLSVYSSRGPEPDEAVVAIPYAKVVRTTPEGAREELGLVDIGTFAEGDPVSISLGLWGYGLNPVFCGEIAKVNPGSPVELICRDSAYSLTKAPVNKTFSVTPANLAATIKELAPGYEVRLGTVPAQVEFQFRCDNYTAYFALSKLAEKFGCDFYVVPGTNVIYFGYPFDELTTLQEFVPVFEFGRNILDPGDLEYRAAKPVGKTVVYGVDGAFKEPTVTGEFTEGNAGPTRTKEIESSDEAFCREEAERWYRELSSSRWAGSFTVTPGRSDVRHSMKCLVRDPAEDARTLHAWVGSVTHNLGPAYTMDVTLAAEV